MENKLEELFEAVESSFEYTEYKKIRSVLEKDEAVTDLIEEIKALQKKSTFLEYNGDLKYKEIDETIKIKVNELNNKQSYIEYLNRVEEFNNLLTSSSNIIESYVNEKIS